MQGSEKEPLLTSGFHFDKSHALLCCEAILAGLVARERGAGGQHIDVSMLGSALQVLWPDCYSKQTWVDTKVTGSL